MESGKHHNKMKKKGSKEPSAAAIIYKGPIKTLKNVNEESTFVLFAAQSMDLSSSVGGVISQSFGSWPSGIADWSNVAATFHEVRTLGFRLKYQPSNKYNRGTVTTRPIVSVVDHTDPGVVPSYAAGANHESNQLHSLDDAFTVTAKMTGTEEAEFQDVATAPATGNRFYIKLYSDGLSFSASYGIVFLEYRIQVRGRK